MLNKLRAWPSQAHPATVIAALLVVILLQIAAIGWLVDMHILASVAILNACVVTVVSYREAVRK